MTSEAMNELLETNLPEDKGGSDSWLVPGSLMVLIINFHAGSFADGPAVSQILRELTKLDARLEVYQSKAAGDAGSLATEHGARADLVICAGGDGTLNEVCSGLMALDNPPPLAYIASGTTCDFARTLRLPIHEYTEAAKVIPNGRPVPIDIGKMNDRYFVYVASFGAFTNVSSTTPRKMKKNWGHIAYIIEGLKSLHTLKATSVHIELKDAVFEEELLFASISNTTSIGGLLRINESHVLMDDGKFEVMLIRYPANPLETPALLSALINQDYRDKNILFFSTSHIKMKFQEPVYWTLDGEEAGLHREVDIQNYQRALRVVLPLDSSEEDGEEES